MNRALVDTGAWYALVDRNDPDHQAVAGILPQWTGRLVTTNFILDEAVSLVRYRLGHAPAVRLGNVLANGSVATLVRISRGDEARAWNIFNRYRDKSFSYTDCTSFAVFERMRLVCAVTLDDDFSSYGISSLPTVL